MIKAYRPISRPGKFAHTVDDCGFRICRDKLAKGKCIVAFCCGHRGGDSAYCHKHKKQRDRIKYPECNIYEHIKLSAKRRGIEFSITLEYFKKWCKDSGFIEKKRSANRKTWSVDRIDNDKGYIEGNLQVLRVGENASKGTRSMEEWSRDNPFEDDDLPF